MKKFIKRIAPQPILDVLYVRQLHSRTRSEFRADRRRFARYMSPEDRILRGRMTDSAIEAQATKDYHRVEKALTLAEPKRPFGRDLASRLDAIIPLIDGGELENHATTARHALDDWNSGGGPSNLVSPLPTTQVSGIDVDAFFRTRHSVRDFDRDRPIDRSTLELAVELAGRSPSVCNRQAWRIYLSDEPESVNRVLAFQNGNRGFGQVPCVALVTVDASLFAGAGERNQGWIDGGLFAMSFTWALHGLGLSACMLNMSVSNKQSDALRTTYGIPERELIIMMIAIGYPAVGHRVARSPRRPVEQILKYL